MGDKQKWCTPLAVIYRCLSNSSSKCHLFNSIQFNTLFETQCFYTLSVHSDNTYNKNILITMKDNRTNNYIIMLIFTKIVKELDSVIVIVDIQ